MCFIFHNYTKWSKPIITFNGGHKQQWRECKDCGKASFRTLRWDNQSGITDVLKALTKTNELEDK